MRKILSFLMLTLFSVSMFAADPAAAGTVLFSEDFSSYAKDAVPSGTVTTATGRVVYGNANVTYTCTNGGSTTKIYNENTGGGTAPEILVSKSQGAFAVAGIPSGGAKAITVSFTQNKQALTVEPTGTGYTGSISGKPGDVGTRTFDITVADGADATFTLTFTGSGSSNVRVDDILVTVKTAGEAGGDDPDPETQTLYCKISDSWASWPAKYAVYYFDDKTNGWSDFMSSVEGETNLYTTTIPAGYTSVIFARLNGEAAEPNWDSKWSQTVNLTIPEGKNLFTVTSGDQGNECNGTWSVYGEEQGGEEPEQVNYYMTGEKATNWVGGWEPNDTPMHGDSAVFKGLVPGTRYQFKITGGSWGNNEKGFNFVNHASRNAGIYTTGDGGNIMFYMNQPGDVKVKVVGDSINVEGNFVHYFLAGNGEEGKAWAGGKGWWQDVAPLAGDSIVYDNLETEVTYEFKVLKYASWNNAMNINNVTAASKALGVKGNDNITFEMAEAGKVVIRVVGDSVALTGNFVKPAEPADPVYAISGSWNNFEKDLFVVAEDKKTASFSIDLEAGDYEFKIRKDDAWLTKANEGNAYGLHREWTGVANVKDEATENLKLTADVDGKYTFVWTFANDSLGVVFPAKPVELQAVSEATTWDFSKITANKDNSLYGNDGIKLTAESTPNKNEEVVYANYSADFMTFAEGFDATTMAFKGEYPIRKNQYCQAGTLHFKTTVAGKIVVKFSDTGSSASATAVKRYLVVNGEQTEYWTSRENNGEEAPYAAQLNVVSGEIAVPAGDVTITGSSAIVMYYVTFTPAAEPTLENGFYLIGKIGGVEGWNVADLKAEQKFAPNLDNPVEFMLDVTLAEGDELKVVNVLNNEITAWFPGGENSNFNVTAAYAGEKTVYFRPDQEGGEGWHYGCIYIAPNQGTGISNTAVEGKAVKMIMDGQLLIIRNGKTYNVQGQQLK